jgi:hypothetical protein
LGVVSLPDTLKGEARANTILKAVTKAKRRVTLSISGLGFLDETEVADVVAVEAPKNGRKPPAIEAEVIQPPASKAPIDPTTGELSPHLIAVPMTKDGKSSDWQAWGAAFIAGVRTATTYAEVKAWHDANIAPLGTMKENAPKMHKRLLEAVQRHQAALTAQSDDIATEKDVR